MGKTPSRPTRRKRAGARCVSARTAKTKGPPGKPQPALAPEPRRGPPAGGGDALMQLRARVDELERQLRLKVAALVDRERETEGLYARIAAQAQELQQLQARRPGR